MLKDDPYYIIDDRPKVQPDDDVDSIPVVRLDDMPTLNSSAFIQGHYSLPLLIRKVQWVRHQKQRPQYL